MKKEIVKILCCPTCKGSLILKVEKEDKGDIIEGSFTCNQCHTMYPIKDSIPDLLPRDS
jgi:uncharacterized protein YbaR (Trm112 family)